MSITSETTVRDQIENLFYRYARGYDEVDFDSFGACFTEDAGVFNGEWVRGRDTIAKEMGARRHTRGDQGQKPRHITTNITIEQTGPDEASVHSLFSLAITTREGTMIDTIGTYTDTVVRQNGEWLIASREISRDVWA